jgi:hypothetical protein
MVTKVTKRAVKSRVETIVSRYVKRVATFLCIFEQALTMFLQRLTVPDLHRKVDHLARVVY